MRDVETQLREYFDAAVERVTVDDVFARQQVAAQGAAKRRRPALRPAWAGVVAFVATLVVLGGSLGLGVAVREPELDAGYTLVPEGTAEGVASTSAYWLLIPALAVAMAAVVALIVRNRQVSTRKERAMATTIETTPAEQLKTAERNNRWLVVTVVVLAVALVALGAWVVYDLASEPATDIPDEVSTLFDDYTAAWNAHDRDAFLAQTTEDYTFNSAGVTRSRETQAAMLGMAQSFHVERVGDLVVMGEGPDYYVTVANEITYQDNDYVGVSTYRLVETQEGLRVAEHVWVGNF